MGYDLYACPNTACNNEEETINPTICPDCGTRRARFKLKTLVKFNKEALKRGEIEIEKY